ncbi:MAG: 16S rRNA (guanine(966)-N(2))-methyltransferase RsmD [Chloroflexota bacterium]
MRVIAGQAKGLNLMAPSAIRPTTSVVRSALFSILASLDDRPRRALDLFAGSGALGIEALSRGAEWVDFVEREPKNCAVIKQNLEHTGFSTQAHVYCAPAKKAFSFLNGNYDIIFLDPPYSFPSLATFIEEMASSSLAQGALLAVCHSSRTTIAPGGKGLELVKSRCHGDTCISLFNLGARA